LNKRFKVRIARGQSSFKPVYNLHVRQGQEPLERGCLIRLKCSAVRAPKATQPEVKFEQTATATPGE
jgi:hypothetical protein